MKLNKNNQAHWILEQQSKLAYTKNLIYRMIFRPLKSAIRMLPVNCTNWDFKCKA